MLELLSGVADVWRQVRFVSEATGLSTGALIGLGALAWFVPQVRALALAGAITVTAGYGGLLYGHHAGRADYKAKIEKEIADAILKGDEARERALRDFDAAAGRLPDDGFERQP